MVAAKKMTMMIFEDFLISLCRKIKIIILATVPASTVLDDVINKDTRSKRHIIRLLRDLFLCRYEQNLYNRKKAMMQAPILGSLPVTTILLERTVIFCI